MDRKVKILGTMHLILGGGGMAACLAACLCWIKLASDAHSLRTAHTLGQMMFMLSMFILLPSLVCSVGLLFEKSWGRVVAIGWSMLLLLVIPIGTLPGFMDFGCCLSKRHRRLTPRARSIRLVHTMRMTLSQEKHSRSLTGLPDSDRLRSLIIRFASPLFCCLAYRRAHRCCRARRLQAPAKNADDFPGAQRTARRLAAPRHAMQSLAAH